MVAVLYRYSQLSGFGCFFFQAEDGIRDLVRSRGLGDVYKRQPELLRAWETNWPAKANLVKIIYDRNAAEVRVLGLSLIHI